MQQTEAPGFGPPPFVDGFALPLRRVDTDQAAAVEASNPTAAHTTQPLVQAPQLYNSGVLGYFLGWKGVSGFGSTTKCEDVLEGVDLSGKTALITGGTSEIAQHVIRHLCRCGALVMLAVRSLNDGQQVVDAVTAEVPAATLTLLQCDLSSLAGAAELAATFLATGSPLHLLINNAATYTSDFQLTADRLEKHFAVNHLAHFALTHMLLPTLATTARRDKCEARIVNVTCSAHYIAYRAPAGIGRLTTGINAAQVEGERAGVMYMPAHAYGQSKLAFILTARELGRRLQYNGTPVTINAVHPGITAGGLNRYGGYSSGTWAQYIKSVFTGGAASCGMLKSAELAAAGVLYAAAGASLAGVSGQYIADCNPAPPSAGASSDIAAALSYQYSKQCITDRLGEGALPELPGMQRFQYNDPTAASKTQQCT